jgi:hypothetical protein
MHLPIFYLLIVSLLVWFFLHADIFGCWSTSDAGFFLFCVRPFFITKEQKIYSYLIDFFLDFFFFSFQPQVPRDELLVS